MRSSTTVYVPASAGAAAPAGLSAALRRALSWIKGDAPQNGSPSAPAWSDVQRRALLGSACVAMRSRKYAQAEALLHMAGQQGQRDAAFLNLLGVIHEARHQWKQARRCYGKAIRADHSYEPAQHNMRRLYELYTFGRSGEQAALGDPWADLTEAGDDR